MTNYVDRDDATVIRRVEVHLDFNVSDELTGDIYDADAVTVHLRTRFGVLTANVPARSLIKLREEAAAESGNVTAVRR